ncbi:MAG: hypothetical protein ACXWJW_10305 [Xanthobacteraceae bacterium]
MALMAFPVLLVMGVLHNDFSDVAPDEGRWSGGCWPGEAPFAIDLAGIG